MSFDDRDEVPEAMSRCSINATDSPRVAASRAHPAPVTPAPITTMSNRSSASRSSAARRCSGPRRAVLLISDERSCDAEVLSRGFPNRPTETRSSLEP